MGDLDDVMGMKPHLEIQPACLLRFMEKRGVEVCL